jgi:hypothetical protein
MGGHPGWDAIVFGEVVFPAGGVMTWAEQWYHRVGQLEAFEAAEDEQLAQVLITPQGVAVRCWLARESFQEWCPRIEAMFSSAARQGGRGDVTFVGVDGPAYRLLLENGRATMHRIPTPGFEHPIVQEIVVAMDAKSARRTAERELEEAHKAG